MGYVFTVAAELAATVGLRLLLPFLPLAEFPAAYLLVMMVAAYLFGAGPAIVALCLGSLLYVYTLPPYHGLWPVAPTPLDQAGIIDLLVGSAIVGFAATWARRSKHSVELIAEDLRRTNQRTSDTLESIAECFIALDSDMRIVDINSVAERALFTGARDELIGRSLLVDYPQLIGSEFEKQCRFALATQRPVSFEEKLWLSDRWFECHVFAYGGCLEAYLRDITDRRQAEEAVRESESRYRSLIETMNEGFCVTDADYVFTYVNPRFAEMIGYSEEEIVGHHVTHFLDEPSRKRLAEEIPKRKVGRHEQYELTWLASDGRSIHALISPRPVFGTNGVFEGSFAAVTDITDLKRSEEALCESEHRYRELFHNANDAIFLIAGPESDMAGRFLDANDVACERLGYTREELLQHVVGDIEPPESASQVPERIRSVREHGHSTFEIVQLAKDGRRIPSEVSVHMFHLGERAVMLAVARDITERKEAEESVRRSEERFRNLFERAADALLLHDLDGRFVEVNQAACEMLGYSHDELVALTVSDIVMDYDRDALDTLWGDLPQRPIAVYVTHRRKDGSRISVEGHLSTIEYLGQVMVLAVVRDITERMRAEEERRALEQHMEEQKRLFYRETIFSVTGGILDICDDREIAPFLSTTRIEMEAHGPEQATTARHGVEVFLRECGLSGKRLDMFMIGVGEAITNSIKHGTEGTVYAGSGGESVWVGIADNGSGIASLILPRAVLLRGFSTKPSLGLGYCVMLEVADRVHLKTDEHGTVVILEKSLAEVCDEPSLDNLPDAWTRML